MSGPPPVLPPPPALPPGQTFPAVGGRHTNGMAVAALVSAFVFAPLAIVLGHMALAQIKRSRGAEDGRGLAIAGMVIGYASVVLIALMMVALMTSGPG